MIYLKMDDIIYLVLNSNKNLNIFIEKEPCFETKYHFSLYDLSRELISHVYLIYKKFF